jgi:2-methylcitrate dehydratase PrpD
MNVHARPPAQSTTAMERLIAFACDAQPDAEAREHAVRAILDTLAVTFAGSIEEPVRRVQASLDPAEGPRAVPSLWSDESHSAGDAALLLGIASHILDYDDVSMLSVCHPSAPILSALMCVAPPDRISGADFVDAFAVGTEVLIRLGQAMGFRHYALGFHATGTLGAVGSAVACARLMRLERTQTAHAIAIAASMASGLQKNFGSMVKSLHVGIAAANGLGAARLAQGGIEGSHDAIEGRGFLFAYSGGEIDAWRDTLRLGEPFAMVEPGFEQKRYPCCYMLHRMIEGTLKLVRETGVTLGDVASARVDMPQGGTKPLIHPFPKSGLNALFSAPYAVLASLADGRIDLRSFSEAAVKRPEIQSRLRDVTVVESAAPLPSGMTIGDAPVTVTLSLKRGETLAHTVTESPGSKRDPLTPTQLKAKWVDCLDRSLPQVDTKAAAECFEQGLGLCGVPRFGDWLSQVRPDAARAIRRLKQTRPGGRRS